MRTLDLRWAIRAAGLVLVIALVATAAIGPADVAARPASPPSSMGHVALVPWEDARSGIRTVVPDGWEDNGHGVLARVPSDAGRALIVLGSAPIPAEQMWPSILSSLDLSEVPDPSGHRSTQAGFDWTLFTTSRDDEVADVALSSSDGTTYLVMLVSPADERDALVRGVFLVVVDALEPLVAARPSPGASSAAIVLEPIADEAYGLRTVAPVGWRDAGMGIRTRGATLGDPTLLALQSAPVAPDALWPSLLPQLGLTEVPDATAHRTTTAGLDWAIHEVPMGATTADLGLAAASGVTYLVLLVSSAIEHETLRDAVFLPAIDALAPLAVERTPLPSGIGYSESDVALPGGAPDVTLAGTLTIPSGEGPHPAIVLMSGSGPQDRDESLPGMTVRPFALIADALGRAGVAVLRYDDRGTAASTGDHGTATLADFTADGQAAFEWLRQQPGIDPARVGVLGHSEGGAYIAAIAANDPDVAFVVGLAPMVRPGIDLMLDQTRAIARSQGLTVAQADASMRANQRLYEAALTGDPVRIEQTVREVMDEVWDALDAATRARLGDRDAWIEQQVATQVPTLRGAWFRSLLEADPSTDWAKVAAPVLGVFGGKDVQVIAGPESAALRAAVDQRDARSRIEVLADANHLFQAAVTGGLEEYPTLQQTFTPDLLPLLTDWIAEVTGLDG